MSAPLPYFSFFPALPIAEPLRLGAWCIGYPTKNVPWRSQEFRQLAEKHLEAFAKKRFKNGALMWHAARGFDGSIPGLPEWSALQATIAFCALDGNDPIRLSDPNAGHYLVTTENAELYSQPIDESGGSIAQQDGGRLRPVLIGAVKIGQEVALLPDATVPLGGAAVLCQCVATALHTALLDDANDINRRIGVALQWHRFALSNPRAISWEQRLVALKTGFEALTDESGTWECARAVRKIFEDVTRLHVARLPWEGLLWSPTERVDLVRTWTKKNGKTEDVVRSELEDWFVEFGAARNDIIHKGILRSHEYSAPNERPLSPYAGPFFWTADRLLRETVKALLGVKVLLCGLLPTPEEEEQHRRLWDHVTSHGLSDEMGPVISDAIEEREAREARPDARDVASLLAALGCDAPNKVALKRLPTTPSGRAWSAHVGGRSMLINDVEYGMLKAAGAEDERRGTWRRC